MRTKWNNFPKLRRSELDWTSIVFGSNFSPLIETFNRAHPYSGFKIKNPITDSTFPRIILDIARETIFQFRVNYVLRKFETRFKISKRLVIKNDSPFVVSRCAERIVSEWNTWKNWAALIFICIRTRFNPQFERLMQVWKIPKKWFLSL